MTIHPQSALFGIVFGVVFAFAAIIGPALETGKARQVAEELVQEGVVRKFIQEDENGKLHWRTPFDQCEHEFDKGVIANVLSCPKCNCKNIFPFD